MEGHPYSYLFIRLEACSSGRTAILDTFSLFTQSNRFV